MKPNDAWRRQWTILGGLLLASVVWCAGCQNAIVGRWTLVSASPNRDVFCIDKATFRGDGSYAALITHEGHTAEQTGTYRFIGYELMLRPAAGGQRKYTTVMHFGSLDVRDGRNQVILKRVGSPE